MRIRVEELKNTLTSSHDLNCTYTLVKHNVQFHLSVESESVLLYHTQWS